MIVAEGFNEGSGSRKCRDFIGLPFVRAKTFKPYYVSSKELSTVDFEDFERTANCAREIFKAPHLIIKQSPKNGVFFSEVLDYDAAFNHSLLGIHGDISKLKYLSVIIGSTVFSYYHILTNRKWLVERDELEAGDIRQTPVPAPTSEEIAEACEIFDDLTVSVKENSRAEKFVRRMYRLTDFEEHQIDDVARYVVDYFTKKDRSISFERPDAEAYQLYHNTIADVLANTFGAGAKFTGILYAGNAPLSVLVLSISEQDCQKLEMVRDNKRLNEILLGMETMMAESRQTIFIRRNLRIYQPDKIFIVKPAQRKYWTYSAACRDADEIFEDISRTWRNHNE